MGLKRCKPFLTVKFNLNDTGLTRGLARFSLVNTMLESVRLIVNAPASYAARLACNAQEVRAAQALRFEVFNLELNEGLAQSYESGLDEDPFDAVCDHLLVEHLPSRHIVGTYRLQTGVNAAAKLGYYSAQEFDFLPYEPFRREIIELGRACVHIQHRNLIVLGLLWKGIADYAKQRDARYFLGCSSITSQDPAVGASAYSELCRKHLVPPAWRTRPLPEYECPLNHLAEEAVKIPKLLRAYLSVGAKICGPPALDRSFKTIDFLTLLDSESVPPLVRQRFTS
jgi:putative hemolysin